MKKFYSHAGLRQDGGGFTVCLDEKAVKTPAGHPLALPNRPLGEAVASEWTAQGETIRPQSMPVTRVCNSVIDGVAQAPEPVVEAIMAIAAHDLLCYRAEDPPALRERQDTAWSPLLDWLESRHGSRLQVTTGVLPVPQGPADLAGLKQVFAALDPFRLAAAHMAATLTGSAVIAAALIDRQIDLDAAWAAAQLDETWQAEQWGEDGEAMARDKLRRDELAVAVQVMGLMSDEGTSPSNRPD